MRPMENAGVDRKLKEARFLTQLSYLSQQNTGSADWLVLVIRVQGNKLSHRGEDALGVWLANFYLDIASEKRTPFLDLRNRDLELHVFFAGDTDCTGMTENWC